MTDFSFTLLNKDNRARRGRLVTPHGIIETPIFMPVGTQGSVKSLAPDDLLAAKSQIVLGNTYHLMLRPGDELIKNSGGLHKFMAWDKPILTDSGGFQVFSLAQNEPRGEFKSSSSKNLVQIDDDGVTFKSYIDGSSHRMTPEDSMRIQMNLGADIIMAFDQCPPGKSSPEEVRLAMIKTTNWLKRCKTAMNKNDSKLFGIIQGGIYPDLRTEHAQEICSLDLFGYAVGGLSVGEEKKDMWPACAATTKHMPENKPRYLMGVGTPEDLLDGIYNGIDMFDCVMPTRNARNGSLFTSVGKVSIKHSRYRSDQNPLDENCNCYTCKTFSLAYLRHLFVSKELLFYRLASLHNITFYLNLMSEARLAIEQNRFEEFRINKKKDYSLQNCTISHCESDA
ncbi:MAG: tRNA guanosine(34) transglycosylase Tgt [bacterium]|nr:tRNA guanosine(34) transglycosylase Tgt [bacterium]